MKRLRNIQQVKEHDKNPRNQRGDRESTWKRSQNNDSMELQINRIERRIEKIQDMFNKDLEEIKKESIYNE